MLAVGVNGLPIKVTVKMVKLVLTIFTVIPDLIRESGIHMRQRTGCRIKPGMTVGIIKSGMTFFFRRPGLLAGIHSPKGLDAGSSPA
jgi:hypothetical protein